MLELDQIRTNGGTQSRVELNQETVAEYAQAFTAGASFPPVVVFFDGANYWLADGFHRYFGARDAGESALNAEIITGTQRDAVLYSLKANATHGLRRTNADKRKAVETLLKDAEWATWSDRKIAEVCGVSHELARQVRGAICHPLTDGPVFAGLDLSARLDLTAMVIVGQVDEVWHVQSYFWCPESGIEDRSRRDRAPYSTWHRQGYLRATPGASVDYEFVAADIAEILADLDVQAIAFDRWRIDLLKKEFDRLGVDLPLVEHGQGFRDMSVALDALEAELLNGRIAHGGNPVLTMCAANAVVTKDPAGGRKLDKAKATGRIDGLQALAMSMGVASKATEAQGIAFDSFTFV